MVSPQATHGRVRAQALPGGPHVSLGRARRVHAQEPPKLMHQWVPPLRPVFFLFAMQAFLKLLEKAIPGDSKLQFRTDTRTASNAKSQQHRLDQQQSGGTFGFQKSLYANDETTPLASRAPIAAATNAIYNHFRMFGRLVHVGRDRKKSKTGAMYCPARKGGL